MHCGWKNGAKATKLTPPPLGVLAVNTGVLGAPIGGFAFGNLSPPESEGGAAFWRYICAFAAVHMCTCAAIWSALLYRCVNNLRSQAEVAKFTARNRLLLGAPLAKFSMGLVFYLLSVILLAWDDLEISPSWQGLSLVIGVGGVGMTVGLLIVTTFMPGLIGL